MVVPFLSPRQVMFRRKLRALDYHSADSIDPSVPEDLKVLVVWLEDQKIRTYKIEERLPLRNATGKDWSEVFRKYLEDLSCPFDVDTSFSAAIDWLLGYAVQCEFEDQLEQNADLKSGLSSGETTALPAPLPLSSEKSALDVDPKSKVFAENVQTLARMLMVTNHPDPTVTLEAVRLVIEEKLSQPAKQSVKGKDGKKERKFKVSGKECGFNVGNPALEEAATALRLLHIRELRTLQTQINQLIVTAQGLTADPKTNTSLGVVGT